MCSTYSPPNCSSASRASSSLMDLQCIVVEKYKQIRDSLQYEHFTLPLSRNSIHTEKGHLCECHVSSLCCTKAPQIVLQGARLEHQCCSLQHNPVYGSGRLKLHLITIQQHQQDSGGKQTSKKTLKREPTKVARSTNRGRTVRVTGPISNISGTRVPARQERERESRTKQNKTPTQQTNKQTKPTKKGLCTWPICGQMHKARASQKTNSPRTTNKTNKPTKNHE